VYLYGVRFHFLLVDPRSVSN